jgi:regulation of enolase protein 1 (concanavalin A-like superfamily)
MLLSACCVAVRAQQLDTLIFGDAASESAHSLTQSNTVTLTGALGQPARRCISNPVSVYGGTLTFNMAVDPVRRNYFSVKFWGTEDFSTVNEQPSDMGALYLYIPLGGTNWQNGYRHEGDYFNLNAAGWKRPLPGRFFYSTTLLPLSLTKGRTNLTLRILSAGRLYPFGSGGPPSGNYQFAAITNSRAIYRAYTHTDPVLIPTGETQGSAPTATTRPTPTETQVLGAAGTFTTSLNSYISGRLSTAVTNLTTTDVELLARSYSVTNLSNGYLNPAIVSRVITAIDMFANAYYVNTNAVSDSSGGNEWWGGRFGPLGHAVSLLVTQLGTNLDAVLNYTNHPGITRRQAWGDALAASRDFGRFSRDSRYLSNQGLIANANIYMANKGLLALGDGRAFDETNAQRYLREAIGLEPWLGSDLAGGGSSYKFGTNYFQVTQKGLTREWGYVGTSYGEMQYFAADFYSMTSNTVFRDQCAKMAKARGYFRRPTVETVISGTTTNYYRCMEGIGLLAWRGASEADNQFSAAMAYSDSGEWTHAIRSAGATLDSNVVGYAKQMFADNQFFNNLTLDSRYRTGSFDNRYCMDVFDDYLRVKAATNSTTAQLPMTDGQPDFAWADEDNGIVAIKHGAERLWLATYWQAKKGTGINGIGRFHYSTTNYDRIGILETTPQFQFCGSFYTRPNMVDMPEQTNYAPPDNPRQAYAGERLPVGALDPLAKDDQPFRGKALFWATRYANYLIGINRSADRTYELRVPAGFTSATNLINNEVLTAPVNVGPTSTVVLYLNTVTNSCAPPLAPLTLNISGSSTTNVALDWSASSGATSYTVKRGTTAGGPYAEIAAGLTGTSYNDTTVSNGNYYYYVVASSNACGESEYNSMENSGGAGLPAPWFDKDIGAVGVAGSASYNGSAFTVKGAGSDIGGAADTLNFAYLNLTTNNVTIAARLIAEQLSGSGLDKVGLMMRESTNANSILAAVILDTQLAVPRLARRTSTGGSMVWTDGSTTSWPTLWLRLQRSANAFIASVSSNGTDWTQVASNNVTMSSTMAVGMAVCSRTTSTLNASTFDNVTISSAWSPPAAPNDLTATAGDQQVELNWSASAGATGYNVRQATAPGGPYTVVASNIASLAFSDTGLSNGTPYYYVVSALNLAGESPNSVEATATPQAPDPFGQWQINYFGCTNCPEADASNDFDGDGMSNTNEFLAGTDPTDSSSAFKILSILPQGDDVVITWTTVAGKTNALQAAATPTNFADIAVLNITGAHTNYTDSGAATNGSPRFYRVRLVP